MFNSKYNTNLGKTMGMRLNDLNKSSTPGPGAYEFFSDFEGFYKYGKNRKKNGNNGDDDNADENNTEEGSKGGSSGGNTGDSSANGKNVDETISKVKIKKQKLK